MKNYRIGVLDFSSISSMKSARSGSLSTPREIRMIRDAIKAQGHIAKIYKVEKCQLYFDNRRPEIFYNNKKIKGCDILIPRVSVSNDIDLEISIVKQFQMMGISVLNKYLPIARGKNKLRNLQLLTYKGIPVPRTLVVRKLEYLDEGIELVGGYPVIIKSPFGSYGVGVAIVESKRSLYSALDIIWKSTSSSILLIQEYMAESMGTDYRAFVIGDKVVASMQRTAPQDDFRSNLHHGGVAQVVTLSAEEQKMAVRASQALNLDLAGVDLLRTKKGPMIMEVNPNPGFEGLMKASGVDIPAEMVRHAIRIANSNKSPLGEK
jgi:ribosomal protein S6--L-glutamate ligase